MTPADYDAVMALMSGTPGIAVRAADSPVGAKMSDWLDK